MLITKKVGFSPTLIYLYTKSTKTVFAKSKPFLVSLILSPHFSNRPSEIWVFIASP